MGRMPESSKTEQGERNWASQHTNEEEEKEEEFLCEYFTFYFGKVE